MNEAPNTKTGDNAFDAIVAALTLRLSAPERLGLTIDDAVPASGLNRNSIYKEINEAAAYCAQIR